MKIKNIIIHITLIIALVGCKDALDKRDLNVVDDQVIWEDEAQATLYINKLYEDNMPKMSLGSNSSLSDEFFSSSQSSTDLLYGLVQAGDIDKPVKTLDREKYQLIRRINIGIRGLNNSSMSDEIIGPLKGQALFLRAVRYWELVQLYGGVPMVMNVQDPYNDDLNIPRYTTAESIQLIIDDLDLASEILPIEWEQAVDKGRITSGAAMAYKARILLSWASPLFNPENKQERWQLAYDAGNNAINLLSQMSVPRGLLSDFSQLFTTDVLDNEEAVIYRRYSSDVGSAYASGWEANARPPSTGGVGSYNPTWELVKAFPMSNGKLIMDANSGYDSTLFWQDRDPRFYATVAYNGCDWDMEGREAGQKQWNYIRNIHENNRAPASGFWCKKATDPTIPIASTGQTSTSWIELRYAEVLLNQAECANELGKMDEALTLIRRIRQRAGIESGNGTFGIENSISQIDLRQIIMIERQVEFAFENKRYWDLRRRLMFRNDMGNIIKKLNGTKRHGLQINAKEPWDERIREVGPYRNWSRIDTVTYFNLIDINNRQDYNTYFTTSLKVMEGINTATNEIYNLNYLSLYDFLPIYSAFLQKSPAVEQTKGWVNGTFDPLAE